MTPVVSLPSTPTSSGQRTVDSYDVPSSTRSTTTSYGAGPYCSTASRWTEVVVASSTRLIVPIGLQSAASTCSASGDFVPSAALIVRVADPAAGVCGSRLTERVAPP